MKNFAIGLGIGLLGVILWVLASVVQGLGTGVGGKSLPLLTVLMIIGFVIMFAGPVTFWIILPIKNRLSRRKSNKIG